MARFKAVFGEEKEIEDKKISEFVRIGKFSCQKDDALEDVCRLTYPLE